MFKKILFLILALSLISFKNKSFIQIKGSDTMVNLVGALSEKYMEFNPTEFIAITGGGSGTGISSLINGKCDIAMTSRPMKEKEITLAKSKNIEPNEFIVALDGIAVVVHPSNPVSKLTIDELASIFSGKIKNWKEVGGKDRGIVILSREVNSGTHVYFKEHVLRKNNPNSKEEFAPSSLLLPSSQAIADEVANNPDAIGYYGMGYISCGQKTIAVAKDKDSPYYEPTIENIRKGNYPISRPLYFYTNGKPKGLVKKFIDFVLSEEAKKIIIETDFVPIN